MPEIKTLPISALLPAAYNPRRISERALDGLRKSIERFDLVQPIIWNQRTATVVGGHQRVKALMQMGRTETQVVVVDLPESEEKALNVALNSPAISGEFTDDLQGLLLEIEAADAELFEDLHLGDLQIDINVGPADLLTDPDEIPEPPPEPITKRGDVWVCGKHRVMCGDSTVLTDVEKLLGGAKADMLLSDPPYGVSYVGGTKDALVIENDDLDESDLAQLVDLAFGNAQAVCRDGAYWYATVPAGPLHLIFALDWKRRGILRQIMVWVKDSLVLGHSEYHYRHEPILFGWLPGARHKNSDRTRDTVWECPRPKSNREHPTMKPVELWARAIEDGSRVGEIVYDPFLGSGTTLLASEQLGRRCCGMEIDPKYCDVIVKRWQNATGKAAVLESSGIPFGDH